jgi:pilus assembly protein Flp/PilA
MKALCLRFVRNDEGQDLIEYVLLGALVSTAIVAGASALGTSLNTWYDSLATWASTQAASL